MSCGKKYSNTLVPNKLTTSVIRQVRKRVTVNTTPVFTSNYNKSLKKITGADKGMIKLKTAYDGEQTLPVTRIGDEIYLIANVAFAGKQIQFIVFDLQNMDSDTVENEFANTTRVLLNVNTGLRYKLVHFNINTYGATEQTYISAYYCILCYHAYLYDTFNRVGLINDAHVLVSFVNAKLTNAFWSEFYMVFGNGSDTSGVKPLTSMDVCCHELTHGLISNTVDLVYQGESGALNESIADIFGTCVEFYVNNQFDTPDWTIGEEFDLIIRNMANPKEFQQPTTYGGTYWANTANINNDNGGVHTNSGITNYCCFIAANGKGTYTNDAGKTVDFSQYPALSLFDFVKLVYYMLNNKYVQPSASFRQFASAMLQSAVALKLSEQSKNRLQQCLYAVNICSPVGPVKKVTPPPKKFKAVRKPKANLKRLN